MSQNIVIYELAQNGYEELYPKTKATQIEGTVAEASYSLNSDQLGGISSDLYATKEYIENEQPFKILEVYNGALPTNNTSAALKLSNLTKLDLMKASFIMFKFSNIPQSVGISLQRYVNTSVDLPIYNSDVATGVGTSCVTLNFNGTAVESSTRIARLLKNVETPRVYLVLYDNNKFYTFLRFNPALTVNVTLKIYIYISKS